ncbi:Putative secreted protein [Corynebacterium glyciniphilum AJ 3170]|uniref:Putative secreted protein n=1 Tax=Corynebacterium glyciniphilum AJ 3170 TaxID=1404245 RepID=X5ECV4_9CORY|nr:sulfur carrier protein ThiS [Corynebacterium glyciniphilum]AHW64441.1 Putative secreted protein [Corynebacterium glyciniphilum AJ 3170]
MPDNITSVTVRVNGRKRSVSSTTTVGDIVSDVTGQDPETEALGLAVALDATIVPRSRWCSAPVHDGAEIEIITAMQGG